MTNNVQYNSLPKEIKKIATDSLGLGVLKTLFEAGKTYHLMIKISDGAFIGFVLYHTSTSKVGGKLITTGHIDCVCVDGPYRKEGYGTMLTFTTLRKLSAIGADRVEIKLKSPELDDRDGEPGLPQIGSEKVLQSLGFRFVKVFHNDYKRISEISGYSCAFCSNRPDSCQGILYAIDERSD